MSLWYRNVLKQMIIDLAFIGTSVGFGGIAGFLIRFTIKLIMIMVGLFFAALAYLNYQGVLTINWDKLGAQQSRSHLTSIRGSICRTCSPTTTRW